MKNFLICICKYLLFLFLLFAAERLVFLVSVHSAISSLPISEIAATFWHALHLDLSTACYLLVIPFILMTLQLAFQAKWFSRTLDIYTLIILIIIIFSAIGNIFLYEEWSTKINYKIWYYLQKPNEVLRTATWGQLIGGILIAIASITVLFWGYCKWIKKPRIQTIKKFYWQSSLLLVVGFPLIFIGIRGKITGIPISQSNAYFSKHQILNDAAVNTQWHLAKSTLRFASSNRQNLFESMPSHEAEKIVQELFFVEKDTSVSVLNGDCPNVVIILLESWSADLVESLGGRAGITPHFHELEKEGILFTQVYAAGRRSQEGNSAIISGFPPIPVNVVTDNFEKYPKLGSLARAMKNKKYATSYYFGGDLTYGNLTAYLMGMGFDRTLDEKNFPSNIPHGKLSIHDEYVYAKHLEELKKEKTPFFTVLFTGSSHSPYDMPTTAGTLHWQVAELPYLNSARYADYALGEYIEKAKKEGWYDNTLFILVADHSHPTYKQWNYHEAGYQHIPMLWLGGAIKKEWRGRHIDKLCSYLDLPLTLLRQLCIQTSDFPWSNDIFNPYAPSFAPFQNNVGIGWITPEGSISYDASNGHIYKNSFPDEATTQRELRKAKAYLQVSYQRYLDM